MRHGAEQHADDPLSGAYAVPAYQPADDASGAYAGWGYGAGDQSGASPVADYSGQIPGQMPGQMPIYGYNDQIGHTGYMEQPAHVPQAPEQHTGAYGYDARTHGWEHPAPAEGSGTWSVPGTMPGQPAHWDDPLYGSADGYATDGHAVAQASFAPTYDTTTFAPQSYAGYGYDTSGGYPAVQAPETHFTGPAADPFTGAHPVAAPASDAYPGSPASGAYAAAQSPVSGVYAAAPAAPDMSGAYAAAQSPASGAYAAAPAATDATAMFSPAPAESRAEAATGAAPGSGRGWDPSESGTPAAADAADAPAGSRRGRSRARDAASETPGTAAAEQTGALATRERTADHGRTDGPADDRPAATRARAGGGRGEARRAGRSAPHRSRRALVAAGGAVVTGAVLAGVVVLQMPDDGSTAQATGEEPANAADTAPRADRTSVSRSDRGGAASVPLPTPSSPVMANQLKVKFPLDAKLTLSGKFETFPGTDPAPGEGSKVRYRVEIEKDLPLDAALFVKTVQETLNDPRSWAHENKTFERVDGKADFVIRLSSPGTLHKICSPIVGDTSENNVSCNANGTPWVMINGWRWAQGSTAFGDDIEAYRQMLINHEVGHRLGNLHKSLCDAKGRGPAMMQQTKTREADNGQMCAPNAWPYPDVKV